MGACTIRKPDDFNDTIKESWKFEGEIYYEKSNEIRISYWEINGNVQIYETNNIKEIYIEGKTKNKKDFYLKGFESCKKKENISYFKIIKDHNSLLDLDFDEDIIMLRNNNEYTKITGNVKYKKNVLKMDLDLYLPKPKKEKQNTYIINFRYRFAKLTDPVDIISNSLCGMKNLINTCYINSSFQILIHIRELVEIIYSKKDFKENVIGNINSIFDKILKYRKESRPVIDPSIFVVNFKREHEEYNNHFQMDSEMFLEDLIWNINLELGALGVIRPLNLSNAKNEKEKLFWNYLLESEEDSFYKINDLFYVSFIHENKCVNKNCNYVSYYFDETTGLKLNFINIERKNEIDLSTLIMNNFKNEIKIKSSYACQKCRNCFYINENTRIAKFPKILILSLQKTNVENTRKIPWIVKFPNEIGIRDLADLDICKGSGRYKLFAINNHIGFSPRSGHYYSNIFLEQLNSWFSFNDESVDQIQNPEENLNNYIIIYKQI